MAKSPDQLKTALFSTSDGSAACDAINGLAKHAAKGDQRAKETADPGHWKQGDLRLDEVLAWAEGIGGVGCHDDRILGHSRTPQRHFKGCWLLDAVMGRGDRWGRAVK